MGRIVEDRHGIVQGLDIGKSTVRGQGREATADELLQVYDTMLGHGFKKEHVQQALQVRTQRYDSV